MHMNSQKTSNILHREFNKQGYCHIKSLFSDQELKQLHKSLLCFHNAWIEDNTTHYETQAINASYITSNQYLSDLNRLQIFKFIGKDKLMNVATQIFDEQPTFMNTQIFFNPVNKHQKNYWHRDMQYHLSVTEQQQALAGPQVIHFRVPLMDEPGIELVAGSHTQWDSKEELDVRLEQNNSRNFDMLSSGTQIELAAGDLLVFSANMIHRGIYGKNRFAFDVLFCDFDSAFADYIDKACLPNSSHINQLENSQAFQNAIALKNT